MHSKIIFKIQEAKETLLKRYQLDTDFIKGFDVLTLNLIPITSFLELQYTARKDSSHH